LGEECINIRQLITIDEDINEEQDHIKQSCDIANPLANGQRFRYHPSRNSSQEHDNDDIDNDDIDRYGIR